MTGIYKITNKLNNKSYIGKASDLELRKEQHFEALQHSNKSWYPEAREESNSIDDFTFEVLQYCEEKELDAIEEYWVRKFDTYNNGYNKTEDGQFFTASKPKLVFIDKTMYYNNTIASVDIFSILLIKAYRRLSLMGIGVYLYLIDQEPHTFNNIEINFKRSNRPFVLSVSKIKDRIGKSDDGIRNGIEQLIKTGYLTPTKNGCFQFRDCLEEDLEAIKDEVILTPEEIRELENKFR